jgi:putative ABC transport system permease protein
MPDWMQRVRERLAGVDLDPATEAEVVLELTQHVDDRYRDLIARGLSDADAEAQAWRELDGHPRLGREIASARTPMLPTPAHDLSHSGFRALWDDFAFAGRRLRHAPWFAIVAVLTVALTVGANTAILSVADAVLFRPLPYADPDNVAIIQMTDKTGNRRTNTPLAFIDVINECCPSVSGVGQTGQGPRITIEGPDGPTPAPTIAVTPNYFGILGVAPARGRLLHEGDLPNAARAAVLSYAGWQQYFGADESVVGQSVTLGSATLNIVGVLPPRFIFPSVRAGRPSIVMLRPPQAPGTAGGTFHAIVRFAPGVPRERAQAEVTAATRPVAASLPKMGDTFPVLEDVRAILYPVGRPVMRYLLAAAGLILVLGCATLANLTLVRGRRHLHETAVRVALGASRLRLIRPAMIEAIIIGVVGASLAALVTSLSFDALLRQVPAAAYGRAPVGVDARVVLMSLGLGVAAAFLFGVVPAWRSAGVPVVALLQHRGGRLRARARLGRPMIVVQVAVAVAVVFGAAVAGRAFISLVQTPLGFSADNVLLLQMLPPKDTTDRRGFYEQAIEEVRRHPHVFAAGAAGSLPFSGGAPDDGTTINGEPTPAGIVHVMPGYFETASIQVLRGRVPTTDDLRSDPDVAVLSTSAALVMFGDRDPIGLVFSNTRGRTFRVVGIVGSVIEAFGRDTSPPAYVLPGADEAYLSVVVRLRDRSEAAAADLRARLRPLTPVQIPQVEWWQDRVTASAFYRDRKFQTLVLGSLAALAVGLTALGIFSVVAWLVAARTREMGVRLAIGASPASLVGLVVRQSLGPVAIGLASGLLLIFWGRGLAEAQLFTVDANDPVMLAMAIATVVVAALLAAWLPARRATRINPTDVLRAE